MDPDFQFAYWSCLVQSQQLETLGAQLAPWHHTFSIDHYPQETSWPASTITS